MREEREMADIERWQRENSEVEMLGWYWAEVLPQVEEEEEEEMEMLGWYPKLR